ncbi:protein SET isoform X2 [Agrilus planipennis]|uniref:Protein SET isoform X2 n=1 Tax=Agrilus planipennis TaxID=224129 RepID=A0A1W4XAU2_AGRPL|nr:protein SET isoform X2 [Agrilus planipennis]XP_018329529.1 protein SET isoform X2 [Agrilus planipennis]
MAGGVTPKKVKKLADSTGNPEDTEESREFDSDTQKALEEIDGCQHEIDVLNEHASEEILSVEQKYNKLRKPYFEKRSQIVDKIPNFWFTAFINHPDLGPLLEEGEEEVLQHLTKIESEEFEDIKSGYKIDFYFDENPYFENNIISKVFHMYGDMGRPKSSHTPIKWKEGSEFPHNCEQPRTIVSSRKRRIEHKSFFSWLQDHSDPVSDEIAEIIKDDLWLNPLQYFLVPDVDIDNGIEEEGSEGEEEENETAQLEENDENQTTVHGT